MDRKYCGIDSSRREWKKITQNPWILQTVQAHHLEFQRTPSGFPAKALSRSPERARGGTGAGGPEILRKEAMEPATSPGMLSLQSRGLENYYIPKRLNLLLKSITLQDFLDRPPFRRLHGQARWTSGMLYLMVLMAREHRRFLRPGDFMGRQGGHQGCFIPDGPDGQWQNLQRSWRST